MESVAKKYADRRVASVFLYTREAHPGEQHPHLESFDQKLSNAREMIQRLGVERKMLVDDYEGTVHHAYGLLPNMTYIVARRGRIVYRAGWTDARTIDWMLEQMESEEKQRRDGRRILSYYLEMELGKVADRKPFMHGLRVYGGLRAVDEYVEAVATLHGEGTAKPLRKWRADTQ